MVQQEAHGINFVFATGRHHVDVGQIRDNLEIKSYMITSETHLIVTISPIRFALALRGTHKRPFSSINCCCTINSAGLESGNGCST